MPSWPVVVEASSSIRVVELAPDVELAMTVTCAPTTGLTSPPLIVTPSTGIDTSTGLPRYGGWLIKYVAEIADRALRCNVGASAVVSYDFATSSTVPTMPLESVIENWPAVEYATVETSWTAAALSSWPSATTR